MNGEGFEAFVSDDQEVKAGQKLLAFNRDAIKAAGYSDTVAVLVTNSDELENMDCGLK